MGSWVELGLDPALFWTLTPRMVVHIAEAARHRHEREHNGRAWLAWHVAALPKQRRLPRLESLMIKRQSGKPQTWKQQMQLCRMIAAAYGSKPSNG